MPSPTLNPEELLFVFDKDGVLFNSEPVKLAGFESLFQEFEQQYADICSYNRENVGATRPEKLEFIFAHILETTSERVPELVREYLLRAANLMEKKLADLPPAPGVEPFLQASPNMKFVCSNAPQDEVDAQLGDHGLLDHFDSAYGYPHRKADVIKELEDTHQRRAIFWGDTIRDYDAAREVGCLFVGVQRYDGHPVFDEFDIPVIRDFTTGGGVAEAIAGAPLSGPIGG